MVQGRARTRLEEVYQTRGSRHLLQRQVQEIFGRPGGRALDSWAQDSCRRQPRPAGSMFNSLRPRKRAWMKNIIAIEPS